MRLTHGVGSAGSPARVDFGSSDCTGLRFPSLELAALGPSGINLILLTDLFFFFKDIIHLFMRDTEREREAETQAEGEAGSMQGA